MKEYIASLEKEFSLIENGFKEEEKRALTDYKSNDNEYAKNLAFLAYKSDTYQVRMYGVFLFGYLSEQDDILAFMKDEVSKDDNWRVQEVLAGPIVLLNWHLYPLFTCILSLSSVYTTLNTILSLR